MPVDVFMKQVARNLTDGEDGFLRDKGFLSWIAIANLLKA